MKRILTIILALALILCGCSKAERDDIAVQIKPAQDGSIATSQLKILSQEKRGDELVTCYDPEAYYDLPVRQFDTGVSAFALETEYTYQELMAEMGEQGIAVLGSACGIREGHLSETAAYTVTEFQPETFFFGEDNGAVIRVQECYALASQSGRTFYRCAAAGHCRPMRNGEQMLLILRYEAGVYVPIIDPISVASPTEKGAELLAKLNIKGL